MSSAQFRSFLRTNWRSRSCSGQEELGHIRRRPNLPDHETSVKVFAQELKVLADATQVGGAKEGDVFTGQRKLAVVRFTVNGGSQGGVQKW